MIEVAPSGTHLLRDGRAWVPLADTAWNAFSRARPDEWLAYLRRRRAQGFTSVLVSTLPTVHDRSTDEDMIDPYASAEPGFDFSRPNEDYWTRARRMVLEAEAEGINLFLVVLWSVYVESTPANALVAGFSIPDSALGDLPARVLALVEGTDAILVISGDDPFTRDSSVRIYHDLLQRLASAPHLRSMHLWPDGRLPESIERSPALDLVLLQSGHSGDRGAKAIELAEHEMQRRAELGRVLPVINAEPCYEGHRHVDGVGERFTRDEVRRVLWTSVLSGAAAGLGYGAHGLWQWHRPGSHFAAAATTGGAFPWYVALEFPGAGDAALARQVIEHAALYDLAPAQHLLDHDRDGARLAVGSGRAALYLPFAREVTIDGPWPDRTTGWDLLYRTPVNVSVVRRAGGVVLEQPDASGDLLVLAD